jgi:hypothetical protein
MAFTRESEKRLFDILVCGCNLVLEVYRLLEQRSLIIGYLREMWKVR